MNYKIVERPQIRYLSTNKGKEYTKFLTDLASLNETQAAKQTFQNKKAATSKVTLLRYYEYDRKILKNLGFKLHAYVIQKGSQFDVFFFATKIEPDK